MDTLIAWLAALAVNVTPDAILEWAAAAFCLFGVWLGAEGKWRWAYIVGGGSAALWFLVALKAHLFGLAALNIAIIALNLRGSYRLYRAWINSVDFEMGDFSIHDYDFFCQDCKTPRACKSYGCASIVYGAEKGNV